MKNKMNQKGNVLFLILIAVALFAALSYAVTQSTRSGGDASRETNVLNSAQLTQYPASIRTAVMRLTIDGVQDVQLLFSRPSTFIEEGENGYNATYEGLLTREIFHPIGGGAIYQEAPQEVLNPGTTDRRWFFNMEFEIPGIGLSRKTSLAGNDLIAFLPNVTDSVCRRINMEAGITTNLMANIPVTTTNLMGTGNNNTTSGTVNINMERQHSTGKGNNYVLPTTETVLNADLTDGSSTINNVLSGRPFGCFQSGANGPLVYYSVILER